MISNELGSTPTNIDAQASVDNAQSGVAEDKTKLAETMMAEAKMAKYDAREAECQALRAKMACMKQDALHKDRTQVAIAWKKDLAARETLLQRREEELQKKELAMQETEENGKKREEEMQKRELAMEETDRIREKREEELRKKELVMKETEKKGEKREEELGKKSKSLDVRERLLADREKSLFDEWFRFRAASADLNVARKEFQARADVVYAVLQISEPERAAKDATPVSKKEADDVLSKSGSYWRDGTNVCHLLKLF